jgi:hypothetical protein
MFKVQAVEFELRLYQKESIDGLEICGVLTQSPDPLNPIEWVPVLTGAVTTIIEFAVQVPPCVGNVEVKLS